MLQLLQQLNTNQESDSLVKKNKKIILRTHDNSSRGPLGEGPQLCARLRHYKKHNLDPTQKNKKPTIAHNSKNSKWARARRRPERHHSTSRVSGIPKIPGKLQFPYYPRSAVFPFRNTLAECGEGAPRPRSPPHKRY